ncbi:fungal-specific transcription factor domain-containing protein [Chiua virens]|nr:fungal-specific transcription factor domain-containing protein [Chiua virens]
MTVSHNSVGAIFECTYVEAAKVGPLRALRSLHIHGSPDTRSVGPPKGYMKSLENRLEKKEWLLQKVCPDVDFSQELGGGVRIDREMWQKGNASANAGQTMNAAGYGSASAPMDNLVLSDDEDIMTLRLSASFKSMNLVPRRRARFFGKSSGVMLIQKAIDLKKEATGADEGDPIIFRPVDDNCYPWELAARTIAEPEYTFPDNDLRLGLVHLYFVHINPLSPFLHRPSFERKVRQGVHLRNSSFGAVYLLICACASRYSDDTRVFLDFVESGIHEHLAGWKYFEQVQMVRRTLLGPPCLEDLQTYNVCVFVFVPTGLIVTVVCPILARDDVGAHRRKSYNEKNSVEGELWKRAFWLLVLFDCQMSSSLGRPCAIQDEDFDLDYPIECDDEYWEHPDPEQAFKQPPDKPSTVSYFVSFIKLNNILSFAHRTIGMDEGVINGAQIVYSTQFGIGVTSNVAVPLSLAGRQVL